jgi:hypothetical protein
VHLQSLNMSGHRISDIGAQALASALPALRYLNQLDVSLNQIGDLGIVAIARSLPHLTTLSHLAINDNYSYTAGTTAIMARLVTHPSLNTHRSTFSCGTVLVSDCIRTFVGQFVGLARRRDWQKFLLNDILPHLHGALPESLCTAIDAADTRSNEEIVVAANRERTELMCVCMLSWLAEFGWQRRRALVHTWAAWWAQP